MPGWGAAYAVRAGRPPAVALPGVGWRRVNPVLGFLAGTSLRMPGGAGGQSAAVCSERWAVRLSLRLGSFLFTCSVEALQEGTELISVLFSNAMERPIRRSHSSASLWPG